ncbi:NAD(P)/FAD-dependent oxidoreductase [Dokdonella sp. MW10]|uniref:NAD(P)/FAD-dependent oxidoreductase n=1 Tax=Dokdonella sp. MW10 TaxID=2992926 RepID=UPI003F8202BE
MDLKSGYPYWIVRNGLPQHFAPLESDARCDVAVIGAGITGALVARELVEAGFDTLVLDTRDAAWGSTAASTAMIQYEIDTELAQLARIVGVDTAVTIYRACEAAVDELGTIAADVRVAFDRASSLYIASRRWHAGRVRREGALRRAHGFAVDTLEAGDIAARYGIEAPAALLTATAGQVDPYRLAIALLSDLAGRGVRVHDRSKVIHRIERSRDIELHTQRGARVRCRHVVIAAGYESQGWLPERVAANRSSYALVTEPLRSMPSWLRHTLVWETARPYLYLRTTRDGRVLAGGEDDRLDIPARRDASVQKKAARILARVGGMLPGLELEPGFAWAGTFAETADGLPFFGAHPRLDRRLLFAMAYGGNGIVYSVIGARLLRMQLERRRHPLAHIFGFDRVR